MVAALLSGVGGFTVGVLLGVFAFRRRGGAVHLQVDVPHNDP